MDEVQTIATTAQAGQTIGGTFTLTFGGGCRRPKGLPPKAPVDEVQTLTCTATSGTFTLSHGGPAAAPAVVLAAAKTTAAIAFDATAAQVKAALELLPTITTVAVAFSTGLAACSGAGVGIRVTFTAAHAGDQAAMTYSTASLSAGGTIAVAETAKGVTGTVRGAGLDAWGVPGRGE